ncbi:hypothetical protein ET495_07555 [Xylanimonas allomyrinae]|uniref:Uncharacterized protein n=1 Tax=Xylanimonas allomyrinae TaxID=2509459 RepID=A0A4P6EL84_9MICO|nr:hypothetical protein [Xylanimonas allomyrinae]QAY63125.1 hypothetical protein ET495_07555 [Xylanimonas allomyrinae]
MGDRGIGPHEADHDGSSAQARSSARDEETSSARWDDDGGHERATPAPQPQGTLFVRGVLTAALPPELGTDRAPKRYMVPGVLSRHVLPEERALIESPATAARLAGHGYPGVTLKVADRRLEISQTSLATLTGGLAAQIAAVMRDAEQSVVDARRRSDDERARWTAAESVRAARVQAEADRVRFE